MAPPPRRARPPPPAEDPGVRMSWINKDGAVGCDSRLRRFASFAIDTLSNCLISVAYSLFVNVTSDGGDTTFIAE